MWFVVIHCSASDNPEHDNPETITSWHIERGFDGIGYNNLITKDGTNHKGRDINKTPAAQKGHNTGSIAICLSGLHIFTEAQIDTLIEFCHQINKAYDGKITFHGHCEFSNKTCPVFDYKAVLKLDDKGYLGV